MARLGFGGAQREILGFDHDAEPELFGISLHHFDRPLRAAGGAGGCDGGPGEDDRALSWLARDGLAGAGEEVRRRPLVDLTGLGNLCHGHLLPTLWLNGG